MMNDACDKELGITGFNIKSEKKVTPRSLQHHQQQTDQELTLLKATKRSTSNQSPQKDIRTEDNVIWTLRINTSSYA